MNYLDTGALIKRFITEKGSALVRTIVQHRGPVATAKIAYAEVFAGLTRKLRQRDLSTPDRNAQLDESRLGLWSRQDRKASGYALLSRPTVMTRSVALDLFQRDERCSSSGFERSNS